MKEIPDQVRDDAWLLKDQEFFGGVGEDFGFAVLDEDIIFDTDAAEAFDVDAGFYSEDHAGFDGLIDGGAEAAGIVDVEAESVAESVTEVLAVIFFVEDLAGEAINFFAVCASFKGGAAFDFGAEDVVIDFAVAV